MPHCDLPFLCQESNNRLEPLFKNGLPEALSLVDEGTGYQQQINELKERVKCLEDNAKKTSSIIFIPTTYQEIKEAMMLIN